MTTTRRLAAILAADVVGYSRLVGADEQGALANVARLRADIIEPNIGKHAGRLFKVMGDGFLAEFASAVEAVKCAVSIQTEVEAVASALPEAQRMRLRVGVHVGDIVVEGDDLLGDGVNIASRLEGIAEPSGISISRAVHDQVRDRIDVAFMDTGEVTLKNIARPVQVFAIAIAAAQTQSAPSATPLPLPDKPSIAVIPFQNMSGDPEQEYFADGMVEDIITALSRFKSLFVTARNSTFFFKNRSIDIKQVGRELGVRYVLEGSVRKAGNRIRITGQLIEAGSGTHLWAETFDGTLDDVFGLQDSVTMRVVGSIVPRLDQANVEALRRKPPENWDSYDHFWRGRMLLQSHTAEASVEALGQFRKAIELDPDFALAHAYASYSYFRRRFLEKRLPNVDERADALRFAERAIELDGDDDAVLAITCFVLAGLFDQNERADVLADRAIALNPNSSGACTAKGWALIRQGMHLGEALEAFDRAIRLNPLDQEMIRHAWFGKGVACENLGRYDEATNWARCMVARDPSDLGGLLMLERNYFHAGSIADAKKTAARIREAYPNLRASFVRGAYQTSRPERVAVMSESIARLGLPE